MAELADDSGLLVNSQNIRSLILHKEKELHEINDKRLRGLEDAVRNKDRELQEAKSRLTKLRDDFQVGAAQPPSGSCVDPMRLRSTT